MLGTVIAGFRIMHPGLFGHMDPMLILTIDEKMLGVRKWKPIVRMAMMKMREMRMRLLEILTVMMIQDVDRGCGRFP